MDRNSLLAQAHQILQKSSYTKEDSAKVESLLALADSLIDHEPLRRATIAQRDRELGRPALVTAAPVDLEFMAYLKGGRDALPPEKAAHIPPEKAPRIRAAGEGVASGSTGGYLVPSSWAQQFESMLVQTDQLLGAATLFLTPTGSAVNYPLLEDTSSEAAIIEENSVSSAGPDFVFGALAFEKCPQWRSGIIRASTEIVNDSLFDFQSLFAGAAAIRMARGVGSAFVTTLLAAAVLGKTTASSSVLAADELFDLIDAVDPAYLVNGSWVMARATLTSILKLKGAGSGNYLFESAIDSAGRPTLLGFPVFLSPSMPAIGAGLTPISFGDHSKLIRRQMRNSLRVQVYVERFAEFSQVGYEAFLRVGSGLLKSDSNCPVAYLAMKSE
ncbi:MAG: phage major capsid protein [Acidobacteriia bacterium]|nr:phage major capsid protein [Terriglobia bacterium]